MQVVKYLSISTVDDLHGALTYLGNKEHPNHKCHEILPLELVGAETPYGFTQRLRSAVDTINRGNASNNYLKNVAQWWVCSFAPGSFLQAYERARYENVLRAALGLRDLYATAWHLGLGGSADFNIIDPGIDLDPIPCLRRSRSVNLLARARHRSDQILQRFNAERQDDGEATIPTMLMKQAASRRTREVISIEKVLLQNTPATTRFTEAALPTIMEAAGFRRTDWELDLRGWLVVHKLPSPSHSKAKPELKQPLRLLLPDLLFRLTASRLFGKQKPKDRLGKTRENTEPGSSGNTPRRTTIDVIQTTSTSDQTNHHAHLSI